LSNTIGLLLNSSKGRVTTFSDASTEKNVTFTTASTQVAGYLYLPKQADVYDATFSFRGTDDFTYQENANATEVPAFYRVAGRPYEIVGNYSFLNMNYSKPPGVSNNSRWQVKLGNASPGTMTLNTTVPPMCFEQSTLQLRFGSRLSGFAYSGSTPEVSTGTRYASLECFDGSGWVQFYNTTVVSASNPYGSSECLYDPPYQSYIGPAFGQWAFDGDYNTYAHYAYTASSCGFGACDVPDGWCGVKANYGLAGVTGVGLLYEEGVYWSLAPTNPFMEAGYISGERDWNYTGYFNTTSVSGNASEKINTFLDACTADSQGYCLVPIYVYSMGGRLSVYNVSVNYTYEVNPVNVSVGGLAQYLSSNNTTGFVNVPLTFYSAQAGIIQVNDVQLDYVGGNSTINVTAHNDAYTSTRNVSLIVHHSRWNYSFPQNVRSFEFVPQTPSSKQVQPRGQSSSKPFLNITSLAYSQPFNFSVYVNESYSCVNLTWWNASNYSQSIQANGTWKDLLRLSLGNSSGVWVWADYACNYTTWRAWRPQVSLRACAVGSYCDEGR
jgi:hypothetical protein